MYSMQILHALYYVICILQGFLQDSHPSVDIKTISQDLELLTGVVGEVQYTYVTMT